MPKEEGSRCSSSCGTPRVMLLPVPTPPSSSWPQQVSLGKKYFQFYRNSHLKPSNKQNFSSSTPACGTTCQRRRGLVVGLGGSGWWLDLMMMILKVFSILNHLFYHSKSTQGPFPAAWGCSKAPQAPSPATPVAAWSLTTAPALARKTEKPSQGNLAADNTRRDGVDLQLGGDLQSKSHPPE